MGGAGGRDGRLEREASSALVQLGIDPCFPVPVRQLLDTPGRPGAAEGHRERSSKRLSREGHTNKVLKGRSSLGGGRGVGCSNGGQRLPGVPPLCPRPSTAFPGACIQLHVSWIVGQHAFLSPIGRQTKGMALG